MHHAQQQASIWIHAAGSEHHRAAGYLAQRIWGTTGHICALSSQDPWPEMDLEMSQAVFHAHIHDAPQLWQNLSQIPNRPISIVWIGSPNFTGLTRLTDRADLQVILANITSDDIPLKRLGLFETQKLRLIKQATSIYVDTPQTADRLIRAATPVDRINVSGPLQRAVSVPPILGNASEFDMIKSRPSWSALNVTPPELGQILSAQRIVLRSNHRMILVLAPKSEHDEDAFAAQINSTGLRMARRSLDQYPDSSTAVYLADGPDEYARWISLSAAVFLANSSVAACRGSDPYYTAAMGAAILYGPYISDYLEDYSRLAQAGAARIVGDSDSLATAVLQTSNPALAAQMGVAAWDYISAGAEATDSVISAIMAHQEA